MCTLEGLKTDLSSDNGLSNSHTYARYLAWKFKRKLLKMFNQKFSSSENISILFHDPKYDPKKEVVLRYFFTPEQEKFIKGKLEDGEYNKLLTATFGNHTHATVKGGVASELLFASGGRIGYACIMEWTESPKFSTPSYTPQIHDIEKKLFKNYGFLCATKGNVVVAVTFGQEDYENVHFMEEALIKVLDEYDEINELVPFMKREANLIEVREKREVYDRVCKVINGILDTHFIELLYSLQKLEEKVEVYQPSTCFGTFCETIGFDQWAELDKKKSEWTKSGILWREFNNIPEAVDHGKTHNENMETILSRYIRKFNLHAGMAGLFEKVWKAIWLHDVGLFKCAELVKTLNKKNLRQKFKEVRDKHGEYSYEMIRANWIEYGLSSIEEASKIAIICKYHTTREIENLISRGIETEHSLTQDKGLLYCIALLKVIDAIDINYNRSHLGVLVGKVITYGSDCDLIKEQVEHYIKHYCFSSVGFEEGSVVFAPHPSCLLGALVFALGEVKEDIKKEFDHINELIEKENNIINIIKDDRLFKKKDGKLEIPFVRITRFFEDKNDKWADFYA